MGKSAAGRGSKRVVRRLGPIVAAAAGATVVVAAVAGRRRRRSGPAAGPVGLPAPTEPVVDGVVDRGGDGAAGPGLTGRPASGPALPARVATAPVDEEAAAWARAVSGQRAAVAPPDSGGGPSAHGDATAPVVVDRSVLRAAADTTPVEEVSVAAVADAVRRVWAEDAGRVEAAASLAGAPARPVLATRDVVRPAAASPAPAALSARRPVALVVGVVVLVLAIGIGVVVANGGGGDRADQTDTAAGEGTDAGVTASTSATPATTVPAPVTAAEAFPTAAERLTDAGSFSYAGTVSATDVSHVRPMLWLSVEATVEGQVALGAGRLREVAVTSDGRAAETVTDGPRVLGRRADARDELAALPFELVPALSEGEPSAARGAALLPTWLASAVGPTDAAPDETGRRRFTATIPAAVLGPIEREREPVDAVVVLTLDASGAPARVEITSPPAGPPLHLVFDLSALGAAVDIQPPA
jgi:hypothetical protein